MQVFVVYKMQDGYGGGGYPVKVFAFKEDADKYIDDNKHEYMPGHFTSDFDYEELTIE